MLLFDVAMDNWLHDAVFASKNMFALFKDSLLIFICEIFM